MTYHDIVRHLTEKKSENLVIAIDGMCGSGKTWLAEEISRELPARVFHMDDYYLPLEERMPGWEKEGGSNIDFQRFLQEVLLPAKRGERVLYRPYSCQKRMLQPAVSMDNCGISIVEGSYSQHPLLALHYDWKIFLYCSEEKQTQRLLQRNESRYTDFRDRWIPMENQYFLAYGICEKSDLQIDNTEFF